MNTDLTDVETTFDRAPDWAEKTDTTLIAFVDHHEHLTAPSAPPYRRVRRVLHRTFRLVGLVPPRHGCRRAARPEVDPDATVNFHVVNPKWADYRRPYEQVGGAR